MENINLLSKNWWEKSNLEISKKRAEIFAGLWFCAPKWHKNFILEDDSKQEKLYKIIPDLIKNNPKEVSLEIKYLRNWFFSGQMYSHTYKMMKAKSFQLTNIKL